MMRGELARAGSRRVLWYGVEMAPSAVTFAHADEAERGLAAWGREVSCV